MRLQDITRDMIREAVDIYAAAAYERKHLPLTVRNRIAFLKEHPGAALDEVLSHEMIERVTSEEDEGVVDSYRLRLGNERYPHMKLTLRRVAGDDYRLVVEAHDRHFELESNEPDALRAQHLREYNRKLKEEIESRWREADLPAMDET